MSIIENYLALQESIQEAALKAGRRVAEINLLVVTKSRSWPEIAMLYECGQRAFGESRPQELLLKMTNAPLDIQWHFVGNLQRNKVGKLMGKCQMIHSVTSLSLASKIAACSHERGLVTPILIEVNTSGEAQKLGSSVAEWRTYFAQLLELPGLDVRGLMTMAPLVGADAPSHIKSEAARRSFAALRTFRDQLQASFGVVLPELSMGMSGDYLEAIAEGATRLRIGSLIFNAKTNL